MQRMERKRSALRISRQQFLQFGQAVVQTVHIAAQSFVQLLQLVVFQLQACVGRLQLSYATSQFLGSRYVQSVDPVVFNCTKIRNSFTIYEDSFRICFSLPFGNGERFVTIGRNYTVFMLICLLAREDTYHITNHEMVTTIYMKSCLVRVNIYT